MKPGQKLLRGVLKESVNTSQWFVVPKIGNIWSTILTLSQIIDTILEKYQQ